MVVIFRPEVSWLGVNGVSEGWETTQVMGQWPQRVVGGSMLEGGRMMWIHVF